MAVHRRHLARYGRGAATFDQCHSEALDMLDGCCAFVLVVVDENGLFRSEASTMPGFPSQTFFADASARASMHAASSVGSHLHSCSPEIDESPENQADEDGMPEDEAPDEENDGEDPDGAPA